MEKKAYPVTSAGPENRFDYVMNVILKDPDSAKPRGERPEIIESMIAGAFFYMITMDGYNSDLIKIKFTAQDVQDFCDRFSPDLGYTHAMGYGDMNAVYFAALHNRRYVSTLDGEDVFTVVTDYAFRSRQADALFHDPEHLPLSTAIKCDVPEESLIDHTKTLLTSLGMFPEIAKDGKHLAAKDNDGKTPWHHAIDKGLTSLAEMLENFCGLEAENRYAYMKEASLRAEQEGSPQNRRRPSRPLITSFSQLLEDGVPSPAPAPR